VLAEVHPSIISATRSRSSRQRVISSARAVSVAATNRRDMADFDVEAAVLSTACPAGSSPCP